ncbi:hypothetical protein, partial [Flavobacterium sp. NKUCC04_CG]|uniref:hypothetical protein n=1 Tax=Flavobacterium sp. NKUCC04_CG TaxID=2842121 RepID=UPI001C5BD838
NGRMDEWTNGRMDEWTNGRMDESANRLIKTIPIYKECGYADRQMANSLGRAVGVKWLFSVIYL